MAILICMDGLGGCPEVTFGDLKQELERAGHHVVLASVKGIATHACRVKNIENALRWALEDKSQKIFLLGQSAGGSAVRTVAQKLEKKGVSIAGVILLSQAMPRFALYMTPTLFRIMIRRSFELVFGVTIMPTPREYVRLIEPVSKDRRTELLRNRREIPGREVRELAFFPPMLKGFGFPTLVIYGDKDQWISPRAHRKLCARLRKKVPSLDCFEVPNAGHLTLSSERRGEVIEKIKTFVETA